MRLKNIIGGTTALLTLLIGLLPSPARGQQKRQLMPHDYHLWEISAKIGQGQISPDGQWVYYTLKNQSGDSAFVRNIKTGRQYIFSVIPGAMNVNRLYQQGSWNFSNNSRWFAITDADTVRVLDLSSGKRKKFRGSSFDFVSQGNRLLIARKEQALSSVILANLTSDDSLVYHHVNSYVLNADASKVAIAFDSAGISGAIVLNLAENKMNMRALASGAHTVFATLTWNEPGNVLAFSERREEEKFSTAASKLYVCDLKSQRTEIASFIPAASITEDAQKKGGISKLYLSDDGSQLFFDVRETVFPEYPDTTVKEELPDPVKIWGAAATSYPPHEEQYNATYWYTWHSDGWLEKLTDKEFPYAFVSGDHKNVMVYNKEKYLPQYRYVNSYADIYLKQRRSNKFKLLLEKVKDQPCECMTSPTGRYIAYFRDNDWWVYDFTKDNYTCVTKNMHINWSSNQRSSTGTLPPYGSPGWLSDDKALIVYDKYDIWLVSADGTERKRITAGERENTIFRLDDKKLRTGSPGGGNQWFSSKAFDEKQGLLITSFDYDIIENGYWWWTSSKGLEKIIAKRKKIDYLGKPAIGKPFLFIEQDFDISPRLVLKHPSGKEELLAETNPQQRNYYWGRSEVINYRTIDGKHLSGALLYPANYDSTKKYPMVVEIYETRSKEARFYIEPSESIVKSNYTINPTVYTSQGYFVLFPDIAYNLNEPGISATRCITAAVEMALRKASIDKNKIGLTGHSFGGYETSFIISQTDMFATAIAGAGITDLPDFYLGISSFGTNLTRVEEDQFRMQVPFYSEAFSRNSPMHNIDKINTPILLYTGDQDSNVDWLQSRRFQIALWRLGKKSAMLVYEGENHVISKEENEKDLAVRMKDWFDYYLKGTKPADWIVTHMGLTNQ